MTDRAARRLFDRLVVLGAARELSGPARVPAVRPMSAAARRRRREGDETLDVELADLPPAARWREWMLRVEAAIFASAKPVPREALVRLVGEACRFDDLIADLIHELRGRPYDLTLVAGGYALRTKTRFAPAIRAAHPGRAGDAVGELTKTETFALTAIAYLQPVTRGEISKLAGREISRDVIAVPEAPWPDRRRHPRPSARRAVRLCDDAGNSWRRSASPRCATCPTSNGSKPKACCRQSRRRMISIARLGCRTKGTRLRARAKSSMRRRTSKTVSRLVLRISVEFLARNLM